jgi:formate-nitrite transporter family protein
MSTTLTVPVNEHDHAIGPTTAKVIVVNYGDYQCADCRTRHRAVEKMFDELIGKVRFVYRHFPLVKVHPRALRAAEAAEAAAAQGKFWEMHRRLYVRSDKLEDRDLRRHAHEIGLDVKRFDQEMANSAYAGQILKNYYDSINNGITGAPTTFINGVLYAMSGLELVAEVKASLAVQNTHQQ